MHVCLVCVLTLRYEKIKLNVDLILAKLIKVKSKDFEESNLPSKDRQKQGELVGGRSALLTPSNLIICEVSLNMEVRVWVRKLQFGTGRNVFVDFTVMSGNALVFSHMQLCYDTHETFHTNVLK